MRRSLVCASSASALLCAIGYLGLLRLPTLPPLHAPASGDIYSNAADSWAYWEVDCWQMGNLFLCRKQPSLASVTTGPYGSGPNYGMGGLP